jgi:hypothetical protein
VYSCQRGIIPAAYRQVPTSTDIELALYRDQAARSMPRTRVAGARRPPIGLLYLSSGSRE